MPTGTRSRQASPAAIDQSYVWLFKRGKTFQQNVRIETLVEQDAFARIWQDWRRQGYPFDHLVPSLGTTLGASGDRPDALATLMGIILNGGVKLPTVDFDTPRFRRRHALPDRLHDQTSPASACWTRRSRTPCGRR